MTWFRHTNRDIRLQNWADVYNGLNFCEVSSCKEHKCMYWYHVVVRFLVTSFDTLALRVSSFPWYLVLQRHPRCPQFIQLEMLPPSFRLAYCLPKNTMHRRSHLMWTKEHYMCIALLKPPPYASHRDRVSDPDMTHPVQMTRSSVEFLAACCGGSLNLDASPSLRSVHGLEWNRIRPGNGLQESRLGVGRETGGK